jgi:hypothetical protein
LRPRHIAKAAKEGTQTMNDKDKLSSKSPETVVEHPLLKRDRALALFYARNSAGNHGVPLPAQESVGPAVFTKLTPDLTKEQMLKNLIAAFKRMGITVKSRPDQEDKGDLT